MRKVPFAVAVLAVALFMAAVHFSILYYHDAGDLDAPRVAVKIPPGKTFAEVSEDLVGKGILNNPGLFRWVAFLTGREDDIKTGMYLFRRNESVARILGKLVHGEVDYARVVIPEGLYAAEIAFILQAEADIDSAGFMGAVADPFFTASMGIDAPTLEGFLFPDTYLFTWPVKPRAAVRRMVYRFRDIYAVHIAGAADSIGMEMEEVVTLASIIQAEAVFRSEMPRISAVYHNRLRAGMRLEADPTVAYALGGVRRRLWNRDLRVDSPYNTYRARGLPPGPICSPGRAALEAAVRPLPDTGEYYFVADGTGRHLFSKTYGEHLRAKHRIKYGPVPPEIRQAQEPGQNAGDSSAEDKRTKGEAGSGSVGSQQEEGSEEDRPDI